MLLAYMLDKEYLPNIQALASPEGAFVETKTAVQKESISLQSETQFLTDLDEIEQKTCQNERLRDHTAAQVLFGFFKFYCESFFELRPIICISPQTKYFH